MLEVMGFPPSGDEPRIREAPAPPENPAALLPLSHVWLISQEVLVLAARADETNLVWSNIQIPSDPSVEVTIALALGPGSKILQHILQQVKEAEWQKG